MNIFSATVKAIILSAVLVAFTTPALAADKVKTGSAQGIAKTQTKSYKTPCTGNCADNSARNLKNK